MKPLDMNIRMYDVGHGDCFLLSFRYPHESRHLLIDFGTMQPSRAEERARLLPVATNIAERCNRKLHAIVATHRHRDHIGGFEQLKKTAAPGNIIAKLKPELFIEPRLTRQTEAMLEASSILSSQRTTAGLRHLGTPRRVASSDRSGLEQLIPGFRFHVLGPQIKNGRGWKGVRGAIDDETWNVLEFWKLESQAESKRISSALFPNAQQWPSRLAPPQMRWFIDRLSRLRDEQVHRLTQAINTEINNTSVMLLIEGLGHKILFPGDAEIGAWLPILANAKAKALLDGITLYKVSHHGSPNGTPRSLFRKFHPQNFVSMLSTRETGNPLIDHLNQHSVMLDTRSLRLHGSLYTDVCLFTGGGFDRVQPTLKAA